ncbi:hypothetical protein ACFW04_004615 [Cataglyphis niger]
MILNLEKCKLVPSKQIKFLTLEKTNGNYDKNKTISEKIVVDLVWWIDNIMCTNPRRDELQEREKHINFLELKAVFYELKCFAENKRSCEILLRIDNTTALSYINHMDSIQFPKLSKLTKEIWQIENCTNRNQVADWAYREINLAFGKFIDLDIDLFASHINAKSWAVDAFSVPWSDLYFYAFPSFAIILRTIQKIITDKADGVLITTSSITSVAFPGCRKIIRQAFILKGVPQDSIPWDFCQDKKICPFQALSARVLEFLIHCLSQVKTYGTLNLYRSAVTLIVREEIGQDPIIKRFFRGSTHLRPQNPKYEEIWNPDSNSSFKLLTKKLVMLLALVTAQRVQTLTKIRISNKRNETEIRIKITDRIKTSGPRMIQLLLLRFSKNNHDILLLTHKKPHRAATTQTISKWIKSIMAESVIEINIFGSHSTRHAITSAVFRRGIDIDAI